MNNLLEKIGRMIAHGNITTIEKKLKYAGLKFNAAKFVATSFFIGLGISVLTSLFFYMWLNSVVYSLLAFAGAATVSYFFITSLVGLFIDKRAKFAENVLPDALLIMSSNLKSGSSPDEALLQSAKTEFSFLATNIKTAGHKIATGIPIEEALKSISEDIDSDVLSQTIKLIIEGIASGGELASILEGIARDIKDNEIIRKEIRSIIFLYATFIFLAVAIISPVLYSVSTELSGILSKLSQTLASGFLVAGSNSVVPISPTNISSDFLLVFAYVNLIITAVFGSLMIALINKGNEKYGLRYIPFILGISLVLFNIGRIVMKYFFGSINIL